MTVRSFNASFLVSVRFPEIAWDGFKIPLGMPMTNRLTAINSRQPLEASQYVCTSSRLGKSTRNSKAAFLPSMHRPWVSCKFAGPVNVSHTLWQFAYAVLDSTVFFSIAIFASVCINLLFGTSIRSLRSEKNWHRGRLHDRAEHAEKISEHWQSEWEESYRILLENTLKTYSTRLKYVDLLRLRSQWLVNFRILETFLFETAESLVQHQCQSTRLGFHFLLFFDVLFICQRFWNQGRSLELQRGTSNSTLGRCPQGRS